MKKLLLACSLFLAASAPAQAAGDALIEGTKMCTRYLPRFERQYGIPTHLLTAIASTESGRYHEGLGLRLPWPWTINAEGKGYYFDTKQQAVAAAQKLRKQGVKSMDVGCMQVNIMHHANAFANMDDAFEPQKNVAYAASFLRNLYEEDKSWKNAAAGYHSKTPTLGRNYAGRVYDSWYQIIDKLRAAKMQVPESSVAAMKDLGTLKTASLTPKPTVGKTIRVASRQPERKIAYKAPKIDIKVTNASDRLRDNGVLIIKPEISVVDSAPPPAMKGQAPEILTRDPITLADASPAAGGHSATKEAKIIRINGETSVKSTTIRTGPNFVFND
jgi:hypothetical protein